MRLKKGKTEAVVIESFKYSPKVTLHPGDVFRCTGGPYYVTKEGEKINMGEHGTFRFINTAKNGILATPYKLRKDPLPRGSVFIYMGEECVSPVTGTNLCPHRIRKMRKKKKANGNI